MQWQIVYAKICWTELCHATPLGYVWIPMLKNGRWVLDFSHLVSESLSPLRCGRLGPVCHRELLASPGQSPGWLCSLAVCLSPPQCEGPDPPRALLWTAPPHWPRPPDWTARGCCLEGRGTVKISGIHIAVYYCLWSKYSHSSALVGWLHFKKSCY